MKKLFLILIFLPHFLSAQIMPADVKINIEKYLNNIARKEIAVGKVKIDSASINKHELQLFANVNASYIPFRTENVKEIYADVQKMLPAEYQKYKLKIFADRKPIESFIPLYYGGKKKGKTFKLKTKIPIVTDISKPYKPSEGLQNRHIALWQSHGLYFDQAANKWLWQRARLFETVEDLYTQSYVLPFLVPMLENAGANVLLPRERDYQKKEIIVDNDESTENPSSYKETNGKNAWGKGSTYGFADLQKQYIDFENPFTKGTFRQTKTVKNNQISQAEWIPNFPESGEYAVYVSYKSLKNSSEDALYTVCHQGGISEFKVNQKMGGGTWIYLGKFKFNAGKNDSQKVVLSNKSSKTGKIVTADAVKFGGGVGNIARKPLENKSASYKISNYPRYAEAARYWLQWAGAPDSVYSESNGKNDYTDDYKSRGRWVNYLAGGSKVNPKSEGLKIPIDMSLAFHSDAGFTPNDSIVGSLGIYFTNAYDGKYSNGAPRDFARDLTDLVQTNVVRDVSSLYEPNWSRRGMWNQSYFEARVPRVPAMLLEILSHQNLADMRYGLDPRFRFTVSRAVYKGILQFISSQNKTKYIVQPLPADNLSLKFTKANEIQLSWKPVNDSLEPTATPEKYIVYSRVGNGGFDNGTLVETNSFTATIQSDKVYSFKVTAVNKGGESFPSEILSVAKSSKEKGVVLVVNGFDRLSAPANFSTDSTGGFLDSIDHGVPYINDYKYVGKQIDFNRKDSFISNNRPGFGASDKNYETDVIAGNTFDYPKTHGEAILKAGYSFVSCSDEAVENNEVNLNDYKIVDLILGKEYQTQMGRGGVKPLEFKTFTDKMQSAITDFCKKGGNIFVSGAYVGTDLWNNSLTKPLEKDTVFAKEVLKYRSISSRAAKNGELKSDSLASIFFDGNYQYFNELNSKSYVVESPDAIEPADENGTIIFRYAENNLSAGIVFKGNYKTCILGFPFESIKTSGEREKLMKEILAFLAP